MARLTGAEILLATGNAGKREEFAALLAPFGCMARSLADFDLPEPEETESSFAGNARLKAMAGALASGLPTLADDSGLVVDALAGGPGIYTADWAETTNGRDFFLAMHKTWCYSLSVGAGSSPDAAFICTLVLAWPSGATELYEGRLQGHLTWPARGTSGHGYDPIFQPLGHTVTLGEMAAAEKNQISHRAEAVRKLIRGCFT
ncbi:MAG: non-canonical purine NTP pyrophosphatase [bacterium]